MKHPIVCIAVLAALSTPSFGQSVDTAVVVSVPVPAGAKDTATFAFRDTDLREVFRGLATQHGLNVFVDNAITKRMTVSLSRVRVDEAIKFLCEQNGLVLSVEGGIYKITLPVAPKADPPPPKIPMVYYERGLLTLKLKNDDLEQTILLIQERAGRVLAIGRKCFGPDE